MRMTRRGSVTWRREWGVQSRQSTVDSQQPGTLDCRLSTVDCRLGVGAGILPARNRKQWQELPGNESDSSGGAVAHAPAAISRSGVRVLRVAVDAAACDEGLLR